MAVDNSPLLRRKMVLLAKAETTTGTAISLGSGDGGFIIYNVKLKPIVPVDKREALNSMETLTGTSGPREASLEFESDFAGAGAAGDPAWASLLLPACGMSGTAGVYSFVSGPATLTTLTMGLYEMGRVRKVTGSMGTWTIPLVAGRASRIKWKFRGLYGGDSDVSLPVPTLPTVLPPRFAGSAALAWGAFAPVISQVEVSANNQIEMREDANKTEGYRSAIIVDRSPGGKFQPEATLAATINWHTIQTNSTEAAFSAIVGVTANNIITVAAPAAQVEERDTDERNKIITDPITWFANRSGSTIDSAMTLTFT
jgi:hypothetical protein